MIMEDIKAQIETLLYEEAADFEISKLLKRDIKEYFETLEESFATNSGKGFLLQSRGQVNVITYPHLLTIPLTVD